MRLPPPPDRWNPDWQRSVQAELERAINYLTAPRHLTTGSAWNTEHLVMGAFHVWLDSTGDLRVKNGPPTSDTDGTVVGAQS